GGADHELGGRAIGCGGLDPAEGSDDGAIDESGDQPTGCCTAEYHTGPDEIAGRGRMIGIREPRVAGDLDRAERSEQGEDHADDDRHGLDAGLPSGRSMPASPGWSWLLRSARRGSLALQRDLLEKLVEVSLRLGFVEVLRVLDLGRENPLR